MHASRGKTMSPTPVGSTLSVPHGTEYMSLLNVPSFKAALIEYLTLQFVTMAQKQSVRIVVDSPSLHNPKSVSINGVVELIPNEQGEAHYALWHHAVHCQGNDVLIVSGDTDVWVYGLALWEAGWLCNRTIVVQRGLSGEYINIGLGARYIKDCAQLQHVTNPIATIVGLYTITGCDYVSSFFKQTKEKFTY